VAKDLYEIGEIPPLGEIPPRMYAQVIRPERFGEPEKAFQVEEIPVPEVGPDDALVLVMAGAFRSMSAPSTESWASPTTSTSGAPTRRGSSTPPDGTSPTSRSAITW
jgi:hypothetical protein